MEYPQFYVGQTGRALETLVREHKYNVRRGFNGSGLYRHLHDTNHALDWGGSRWVWRSGNEKRRLVVESAIIQQVPNMNLTQGVSSVTLSASELVLKSNPRNSANLFGERGVD